MATYRPQMAIDEADLQGPPHVPPQLPAEASDLARPQGGSLLSAKSQSYKANAELADPDTERHEESSSNLGVEELPNAEYVEDANDTVLSLPPLQRFPAQANPAPTRPRPSPQATTWASLYPTFSPSPLVEETSEALVLNLISRQPSSDASDSQGPQRGRSPPIDGPPRPASVNTSAPREDSMLFPDEDTNPSEPHSVHEATAGPSNPFRSRFVEDIESQQSSSGNRDTQEDGYLSDEDGREDVLG
ncbi:MAG: hypothetical protein Q9160_001179 [Pyrenula sp. 1 TL-2023]